MISPHPTTRPPLISVIISTYNRAHTIELAIESILQQTFTDFEFIIVNDGATDNTQEILTKYTSQDRRIRLLTQENQGLAASRNNGIDHARGEYIAMMDDDDISMPERLEKQLAFLQSEPSLSACVCESYYMMGTSRTRVIEIKDKHNRLPIDKKSLNIELSLPLTLSNTALFTKKSLLQCHGYRPEFTFAEDLDLSLRFQEKFEAGVVQEPLYEYRAPESHFGMNLSTRNLVNALHCHIAAYICAWYRRNENYDPLKSGEKPLNVLPLVDQIPLYSRKRILSTTTHILRKLSLVSHLPLEDIYRIISIIHQLDEHSPLKRKIKKYQCITLIREKRWMDIWKIITA